MVAIEYLTYKRILSTKFHENIMTSKRYIESTYFLLLQYFYSIRDISIGGRCRCNGHADTCDVLDPKSTTRILACLCRHHTTGIHCNECEPGFVQKKWRQNTKAHPFQCERKIHD